MIYSLESYSFRKFLLPTKKISCKFNWYRFWQKIARRILPGSLDCRGSFLEVCLKRIWLNLFEYILRRRRLQIQMGFRSPFTYSESLKVYRGMMLAIFRISSKVSASECTFSYVSLLIHLLGTNTGLKMELMKLPSHMGSEVTFQREAGCISYQPMQDRLFLLQAALQTAPTYLRKKTLNSNICWWCEKTRKCWQCSECLIARYCSRECAKADWCEHRVVCASMVDFRLASPLGRKFVKLIKTLDIVEPVFFCEVLEYVAYRATLRSVRKHKASIEKMALLRKLLQELLNDDLCSTILPSICE